jgi:hypothetical protein
LISPRFPRRESEPFYCGNPAERHGPLNFGCAVQGRPFEKAFAPFGNAVIYVYRPDHYGSSLLRPAVTSGEDSARIRPGGYHAFLVPTGSEPILCSIERAETADQVEIDPHTRLGALTPTEFAVLKGQEVQPPHEGQNHDRLYL